MEQNGTEAVGRRFVLTASVDDKLAIIAGLSVSDRTAVSESLVAAAYNERDWWKGFLLWHVRLLSSVANGARSISLDLIEEGLAGEYIVSRKRCCSVLKDLLSSALPFWRSNEAPVLVVATAVLLEWLKEADSGSVLPPSPGCLLESHLNILGELEVLNRAVIPSLIAISKPPFWTPIVRSASSDAEALAIIIGGVRRLRELGAPILATALLAATGIRVASVESEMLEAAALSLESAWGARFDRLFLLFLQAQIERPPAEQIGILTIVIDGLRSLQADMGEHFPKIWCGRLALAHAHRGDATKRAFKRNAVAQLDDYDRAVTLFEMLRNDMGERFPESWWGDLVTVYINRGNAKKYLPGYSALAVLKDCDRAIEMLEALHLKMRQQFPEDWRNDLATAYLNRGNTRRHAPGHGAIAALEDYDRAVAIREALRADMGERFLLKERNNLALAYMHRGVAREYVPDQGLLAALEDYDRGIAIRETLLAEMGKQFPEDWRDELGAAYVNRGIAKRRALEHGALAALEDYDRGIEIREVLRAEMHDRFPEAWCQTLATAYINRGNAKRDVPEHDAASALGDYDRAINMLKALRREMKERFPEPWRNSLASAYISRGVARYYAPDQGTAAAIEDLQRARRCWLGNGDPGGDVRSLAPGGYLHCCSLLSGLLAGVRRDTEALEVVLEAGSFRLSAAVSAVLLEEQHEVLRAGASIASLGAWLLARHGRAGEGLEFLEAQHGLMLKEALLRNEHALALRVGDEAAAKISGLQARMHELRHILAQSGGAEAALSRAFAEAATTAALREELRSLKAAFDHAVAEVGNAMIGEGLHVADFAKLAPEGGVIAVPVTTAFGSVTFLLSRDGVVRVLDLRELTQKVVEQRVRALLDAEEQHKELQTRQSAAAFEAVLTSEAARYWTDLVGPVWKGLQQLGYPQSTPVTFVTTGALDLLPLHAASRIEDGVTRYAIEDRVIRCAPGFAALRQMKGRTQAKISGVERVLGVFAPQREHQKLERQTPVDKESEDLSGALYKELPRLKELLGQSLDAVVKSAATRNWFLGELAKADRPASDLHLSMHSEFIAEDPGRSGLKFVDEAGEPASVTVSDLLALGELPWLGHVCLSSCQSGRSDAREMPGEAVGLVMAFIQAGAASVLSSYYVIGDDTTADFMPALYRRRLAGKDVADALRSETCERLRKLRSSSLQPDADKLPPEPPATPAEGDAVPGRGLRIGPARRARPQAFGPLDWVAFKPTCA